MNAKNRSVARVGLILGSALALAATGCATHVHQRAVYVPPPVVVAPPPPVVVTPPPPSPPPMVVVTPVAPTPVVFIQSESDFYEPLGPYGQWVMVAGYGRCWVPARVEGGWRPYSDGYWQRSDAGWYWVSDEPWGWATYHYGRWDWQAQVGWFWVPQTQWAPAWVAWREGGGYVGWAPLRPSVTIGVSLTSVNYEPAFASRAFVFVEHRRLLDPVRPRTVIVNNPTIINQTVNITKVSVVNKTVINEGPRPEVIERESGRKIQTVAAREFRHREETARVERDRNLPKNNEMKAQLRARPETKPLPATSPNPRQEQLVERAPTVVRTTSPAPQPVTVAPTSPSRSQREELARRSERQPEQPAARTNPPRSAARTDEHPANVLTPTANRPTRVASDTATKLELKRDAEPAAKPETKSAPSKINRPTVASSTGKPAPRVQISTREQSRAKDRVEPRSDERGQNQEKRER